MYILSVWIKRIKYFPAIPDNCGQMVITQNHKNSGKLHSFTKQMVSTKIIKKKQSKYLNNTIQKKTYI